MSMSLTRNITPSKEYQVTVIGINGAQTPRLSKQALIIEWIKDQVDTALYHLLADKRADALYKLLAKLLKDNPRGPSED